MWNEKVNIRYTIARVYERLFIAWTNLTITSLVQKLIIEFMLMAVTLIIIIIFEDPWTSPRLYFVYK